MLEFKNVNKTFGPVKALSNIILGSTRVKLWGLLAKMVPESLL